MIPSKKCDKLHTWQLQYFRSCRGQIAPHWKLSSCANLVILVLTVIVGFISLQNKIAPTSSDACVSHHFWQGVNLQASPDISMAFDDPIVWIFILPIIGIFILAAVVFILVKVAKAAWGNGSNYPPPYRYYSGPPSPPYGSSLDSESKFCIKCGIKLPKTADYCVSCGSKQTP